jgi:hypothetical protein
MNPCRQTLEIGVERTNHNSAVKGPGGLQGNEMTAIESHDDPLIPDRMIEHRLVRHGPTTIAGVMGCFDIMTQRTQLFDGLLRKILVGVNPRHNAHACSLTSICSSISAR